MPNILLKLIAFFALLMLSPIIIISMFCIYIEDGRPVIFSQKRIGIGLKDFTIYKIRTMKKDTPNKGTHEVSSKDFLLMGKFLRKTKIDVLPQVFNYIRGDINLVGPRPGLVSQVELKNERSKCNIYKIKPGITGLAQILGYDMSNPKKLAEIDMIYIKKRNISIDFYILLATIVKPLRKKVLKIYNKELKQDNSGVKNV